MEAAERRLVWLLQAIATGIVEPAVVDAAQAAILDPSVAQVSPPVGTNGANQPRLSLSVPEQD